MKRLLSSLVLTSCMFGIVQLTQSPLQPPAVAQTTAQTTNSPAEDLYYTFYGRQIPLTRRPGTIAVAFRAGSGTRGSRLPLYLQLQNDLAGHATRGSRGGIESSGRGSSERGNSERANSEQSGDRPPSPPTLVEVQPLGETYALVTVPANTRSVDLEQRIRQQTYVENTLPVLSLSHGSEETESSFVLPNEIIISFESNLSRGDIQFLLYRNNLEIIRPLQFTQNRYLVRSKTATGTDVLNTANRLNGVSGIQSATPNFVQSLTYRVQPQNLQDAALGETPDAAARLQQILASLPTLNTRFTSNLLPLAWHLNSTPQRGRMLPRTDIRATEAWKQSNGGEDVVVAVVDSLIQWDHPNLAKNLYTVGERADKLPNETHGWDFTGRQTVCSAGQSALCTTGDADTRISPTELATLRPHLQNTFQLADRELLQRYRELANELRSIYRNSSDVAIARIIRNTIRTTISAEFHGTWSAGVIAAQPQAGEGVVGVAPNAQILPVRVFGLGGEITSARLIEAIGYAASRDADVINLSLGAMLPDQELTDHIFQVLDADPKLAIVASAGNDSVDGVAFPAAIPGVISVGATNIHGNRTFYSSYGGRLDVVAPGGETNQQQSGGILTTGGTWVEGFWQGMTPPSYGWSASLDPLGKYVQVQGTSFSAPTVAGVVALMKGVNGNLGRDRLTRILKETASYESLTLSRTDLNRYRLQSAVGMTLMQDRLSGVFPLPRPISAQHYFFGSGLVNAEAAVQAAR